MASGPQQETMDAIARHLAREQYAEASALLEQFGRAVVRDSAASKDAGEGLLPTIQFLKAALTATRARRAQHVEELKESRQRGTYLSNSAPAASESTFDISA